MPSTVSTPRKRIRSGLIDHCFVIFTCVMLFPLPVPTLHRHESFESPELLAYHVAMQHSECIETDLSELHWHFAIPSSNRHDKDGHDGFPADDIPARPSQYTGSLAHGSLVLSGHPEPNADICILVCQRDLSPAGKIQVDRPRTWLVATAHQRHRYALSCVMRC